MRTAPLPASAAARPSAPALLLCVWITSKRRSSTSAHRRAACQASRGGVIARTIGISWTTAPAAAKRAMSSRIRGSRSAAHATSTCTPRPRKPWTRSERWRRVPPIVHSMTSRTRTAGAPLPFGRAPPTLGPARAQASRPAQRLPRTRRLAVRLLLTGGSGFVGRHLAALALREGHTVTALTRDPQAAERAAPGVRWLQADLARPEGLGPRLVAGRPDAVVHLAALIKGTPAELAAVNVDATTALLAALRGLPSPPRFVHVSSFSVEDT